MKKLFATTAFLALAGNATADGIIIEQIFDGINGLDSERNTHVTLSIIADDFVITDKNTITGISATFFVTTDPPLIDWEYDIYANGVGIPGDLIAASGGGTATDTGDTGFGYAIHNVSFQDISMMLDPGTYWISIRGVGQNQNERAAWGTANYGAPNGSSAMWFYDWWGGWISVENLIGDPTDVAFTLHGVPAPGPLALLGVAALAARRRRRP